MIVQYFEKENIRSWKFTFKRWGWLLLLSSTLWVLMVYLNSGYLFWPEPLNYLEIFLTFIHAETMFWSYVFVIYKLRPKIESLPGYSRVVIEFLGILILSTSSLFVINYYPQYLIYGESLFSTEHNIRNIRNAFVVSPIIALLLYYLLEELRNREWLQKERLRISTLEKENYKAQLQLLKKQLSPHFLFNSLNVLTSLIPYDSEKALAYTHRLSDLYRYYSQFSEKEVISLNEELKIVDSYQYLLETRFGNQLVFDIKINFEIHKNEWVLPTGSLQECIGNAVKHNGPTKRHPLYIRIESAGEFIRIENNKLPRQGKVISSKVGWKNIEERYRLLSSKAPYYREDEQKYTVFLPLLNPKFL